MDCKDDDESLSSSVDKLGKSDANDAVEDTLISNVGEDMNSLKSIEDEKSIDEAASGSQTRHDLENLSTANDWHQSCASFSQPSTSVTTQKSTGSSQGLDNDKITSCFKEFRKRQKTDETSTGDMDTTKFHKLHSKVRKRNYRGKDILMASGSEHSIETRVSRSSSEAPTENLSLSNVSESSDSRSEDEEVVAESEIAVDAETMEHNGQESEANSESYEDEEEQEHDDSDDWSWASDDEIEEAIPPVLGKDKPKPNWFVIPEIINRELGQNSLFHQRFYGSLHSVQRLELMTKLIEHKGCVNTLSFNERGNLLASGSDDLTVIIWDWCRSRQRHSFKTGHRSNVFQARWLPLSSEHLMVTCARDGHVRLTDLHRTSVDCSRRIAAHDGSANKLSIHPELPHIVLSVGEDAKVFSIDVRRDKPNRILTVKEGSSKVALYSISPNPLNSNEFCLAGKDQFVRLYDKRKIDECLHKLCPKHLKAGKNYTHITSAVYNYNGSEIIASYNDEDIYLFDTQIPHPNGDFAHRYQGHRNSATVKGVNFFGPKSEFVISGSDCGNIYIWEKNTESIVQWMAGDEHGIVNCLEPHPHIPVLATSGFDNDVKIWVPSCETTPIMRDLGTCIKCNMRSRKQEVTRDPDAFDGQLLWYLWRHMTQTTDSRGHGRRRRGWPQLPDPMDDESELVVSSSSSDNASVHSHSQSEDEDDGRPQCSPS